MSEWCRRCTGETVPLSMPDGQVVCHYCGDCHGVTVDGKYRDFPPALTPGGDLR